MIPLDLSQYGNLPSNPQAVQQAPAASQGYSGGIDLSQYGNLPSHPSAQASQPVQQASPDWSHSPVSPQQNADQSVNDGFLGKLGSVFQNFGGNAVKDVVSTVQDLGSAVGHAGAGLFGSAEQAVGVQPTPGGYVEQGQRFNAALPGALAQLPGKVGSFAKEAVTDPKKAGKEVFDYTYEHPVSAALAASGLTDILAAGAKGAGSVAEKSALAAAKDAAGLTAEEAATASLAGTSGLTRAGDTLSTVSDSLNPLKGAANVIKNVNRFGTNEVLARGAGALTGTGPAPLTAMVANPSAVGKALGTTGSDLLDEANGAIGSLRNARSAQYESDLESLIQKAAQTGAQPEGGFDTQPIADSLVKSLEARGIGLTQATPQERAVMEAYIDLPSRIQAGKATSQEVSQIQNQAFQLFDRYGLGGAKTPRFSDYTGSDAAFKYPIYQKPGTMPAQVQQAFQRVLGQGGITDLNPDFSASAFDGASSEAKQIQKLIAHTVGSPDNSTSGIVRTYQGLNRLAKGIGYDSPVYGIAKDAKSGVSQSLSALPEFASMNSSYASSSRALEAIQNALRIGDHTTPTQIVSKLSKLYNSDDPAIREILSSVESASPGFKNRIAGHLLGSWVPNKNFALPEIAGAFALPHRLPEIAGAIAASSPRLEANIFNALGRIGQAGAAVEPYVTNPVSSSLEVLLSKLGL